MIINIEGYELSQYESFDGSIKFQYPWLVTNQTNIPLNCEVILKSNNVEIKDVIETTKVKNNQTLLKLK